MCDPTGHHHYHYAVGVLTSSEELLSCFNIEDARACIKGYAAGESPNKTSLVGILTAPRAPAT